MYAGMEIGLYEAGIITLFSMAVVFATLYVISVILSMFKTLFKEDKKPAAKSAAPAAAKAPAAPAEDENIGAVIAAAVFEYERRRRANPIARNLFK